MHKQDILECLQKQAPQQCYYLLQSNPISSREKDSLENATKFGKQERKVTVEQKQEEKEWQKQREKRIRKKQQFDAVFRIYKDQEQKGLYELVCTYCMRIKVEGGLDRVIISYSTFVQLKKYSQQIISLEVIGIKHVLTPMAYFIERYQQNKHSESMTENFGKKQGQIIQRKTIQYARQYAHKKLQQQNERKSRKRSTSRSQSNQKSKGEKDSQLSQQQIQELINKKIQQNKKKLQGIKTQQKHTLSNSKRKLMLIADSEDSDQEKEQQEKVKLKQQSQQYNKNKEQSFYPTTAIAQQKQVKKNSKKRGKARSNKKTGKGSKKISKSKSKQSFESHQLLSIKQQNSQQISNKKNSSKRKRKTNSKQKQNLMSSVSKRQEITQNYNPWRTLMNKKIQSDQNCEVKNQESNSRQKQKQKKNQQPQVGQPEDTISQKSKNSRHRTVLQKIAKRQPKSQFLEATKQKSLNMDENQQQHEHDQLKILQSYDISIRNQSPLTKIISQTQSNSQPINSTFSNHFSGQNTKKDSKSTANKYEIQQAGEKDKYKEKMKQKNKKSKKNVFPAGNTTLDQFFKKI